MKCTEPEIQNLIESSLWDQGRRRWWLDETHRNIKQNKKKLFLSSLSSRLEEQGTNASGVPNSTLVAFSYFYLSIVSCLQVDSLQTTLHFLHSLFTSLKEDEHSDDILNKLKASRKVEKSANNFEGSPCLEWNMQEDYNPENTRSWASMTS